MPATTPWLFSAPVDLLAFGGSALMSLVLLAVGNARGWDDTPEWTWFTGILLVDVAHVWATGFRVYFDKVELRRRPWLYGLVPVIAWAIGFALYSEGDRLFWQVLAYVAVFHFVRQQYGWVALYRARAGERDRLGKLVDSAAIYLATIYPLVYWHAHLPRHFAWFRQGDFLYVPEIAADLLWPLYLTALTAYAVRAIYRTARGELNPGKDLVVVTTAVCWYVGIVAFNSDYAFTVTNVIIHGVPYFVLVYWFRFHKPEKSSRTNPVRKIAVFLATLWLLAYVEELLWSRGVHGEHAWLFGPSEGPSEWRSVLVPLLAVPQLTHYILDGFIWRRRRHADVRALGAA